MDEIAPLPRPKLWAETVFGLLLLFEPADLLSEADDQGNPVICARFVFPPWPEARIQVGPHGALGGSLPEPLMRFMEDMGLVVHEDARAMAETGVEWTIADIKPEQAVLGQKAALLAQLVIQQRNGLTLAKAEIERLREESARWLTPQLRRLLSDLKIGPEDMSDLTRLFNVLFVPIDADRTGADADAVIAHLSELTGVLLERRRGAHEFRPGELPAAAKVLDTGVVQIGIDMIDMHGRTKEEVKALAWRSAAMAAEGRVDGLEYALSLAIARAK